MKKSREIIAGPRWFVLVYKTDARGTIVAPRFPSASRGLRGTATPRRVRELFPARGVQRTVIVLWLPEAPPAGLRAASVPVRHSVGSSFIPRARTARR